VIGKVFQIFREKGGLLKALGLWEWYENLDASKQKEIKKYYSLKVIKNLSFPYKARHFDSGEIENPLYTKRTFLATIAQTALLEGDITAAKWIYLEALGMEGTPYEAHLILNDLLVIAQKERNFEEMEKICMKDIEMFPLYREELIKRSGGTLPQIITFETMVYLLERKGKLEEALELAERIKREGITYPYYEQVKKRLTEKLRDEGGKQTP
jgi:hypothetical protein